MPDHVKDQLYDVAVIGGGINGCGIAADAARRGLRVVLFEAEDLAGATSSASSKLIHGGLRYLEQYEFRLVREALAEREVLIKIAPHIVWPMRFILPHVDGMRPRWMLRTGLFLYDHLASRQTLGGSSSVRFADGAALRSDITHGFKYWDCWVDDARLVILNAIAARELGATILTRTPVTALRTAGNHWDITTSAGTFAAKTLINAAGPWAAAIANLALGKRNRTGPKLRLVKGSHIVVSGRIGDDAFILQHSDGRVIFALPFEHDFTLIGTTDIAYDGDPRDAAITPDEHSYLIAVANRYFKRQLTNTDVVWSFAGVRPLEDDGSENASAITRDYRIDVDHNGSALAVHVIGGKITTYRKLAAQAVDALRPTFENLAMTTTADHPLPGGDIPNADFEAWFRQQAHRFDKVPRDELLRLARRYGSRIDRVASGSTSARIGGVITEAELAYLVREESAQSAADVLWRRTKLGLKATSGSAAAIDAAIAKLANN
jgi:glycerol-3-phosphate dehydrogenase